MIPYASNTGTLRNLAALRAAGWRILLTPSKPYPREGMRYGVDNGAWSTHNSGLPFDVQGFESLVERHGGGADFVVVPDIVAGGNASLDFSLSWLQRLAHTKLLLLPVQDGMDPQAVGAVLREHRNLGIFLGGSTEFKLRTIYGWGIVAHSMARWYHVGRVNTARRIRLCAEAGADSFDGTSATMYCQTLPLLNESRKQPSLLSPRTLHLPQEF